MSARERVDLEMREEWTEIARLLREINAHDASAKLVGLGLADPPPQPPTLTVLRGGLDDERSE